MSSAVSPLAPTEVPDMPVIAGVRVMPEYLDESWARLAPLFADLPGLHPAEK